MIEVIKKYYHNSKMGFYVLKPFVMVYHFFLMDKYLFQKRYLKKKFKKYFGYDLNLQIPQTLNEKISWLKLNDRNPLMGQAADKYAVRTYIKEKIGEEYLVPLAFTTFKPEDITPKNLPEFPCIIKVNHNSSGGIIVKNKWGEVNWKYIRNTLRWNMSENYYWNGREPQYRNIKPRIIVEKLLIDANGNIPFDYKMHCFNGKLAFVQVDSDRFTNHKRNIYSSEWEPINCEWEFEMGNFIKKPLLFDKMKSLSEVIARDFIYVRVDFYLLENMIYFGELTFHHGGGIEKFNPHSYDLYFGKMLQLPITINTR